MHTIVRAVHQQLHVHYSARQRSHGEFKQRLFVRVDTMHVQFIRIRIRIFLCARSLSSSTTNSICGIFLLLGCAGSSNAAARGLGRSVQHLFQPVSIINALVWEYK